MRIVLSGNHLLHNTFGCCEKIIGSDTKEHLVTFCNRLQIYKLLGKTELIILAIGLEKGGKQGRTPIYYVCSRSVPLFYQVRKARCVPLLQKVRFKTGQTLIKKGDTPKKQGQTLVTNT